MSDRIVKLHEPKKIWLINREDIMSGKLPCYWGPGQSPRQNGGDYSPPGHWPDSTEILKTPKSIRYIVEWSEIDVNIRVFVDFTATYDWGKHEDSYDLDIVPKFGGIYPSHIHTTSHHGTVNGDTSYAAPFQINMSGENEGAVATGALKFHIDLNVLPPVTMSGYQMPAKNGDPAGYVPFQMLYDIAGGDDFQPQPASVFYGYPPITSTPNGPNSVGVSEPYREGTYSIDFIPYGVSKFPFPSIVVPSGFKHPKQIDVTLQPEAWTDLATPYINAYSEQNGVKPQVYFDYFEKQFGQEDFLDLISPDKDFWYAPYSVTFLLLCRPHIVPPGNDPRYARISQLCNTSDYCRIYILIDVQFMRDCYLEEDIISNFLGQILALNVLSPNLIIQTVDYTNTEDVAILFNEEIENLKAL